MPPKNKIQVQISKLMPVFRYKAGVSDNGLAMTYSSQAQKVRRCTGERNSLPVLTPDQLKVQALKRVEEYGGNTNNGIHFLGQFVLNHTVFKGQSFQWLLSNALSYVGWLLNTMEDDKEVEKKDDISFAKFRLLDYCRHFPQVERMQALKRQEEREKNEREKRMCQQREERQVSSSAIDTSNLQLHELSSEQKDALVPILKCAEMLQTYPDAADTGTTMCTSVTLPMIFPPQPSFGATSKQQGHSKTTRPGRVLIPSTSHTTSQDPSPTPGPSKATGPDHIATPLISSTSSGVSSPTPDYPLLANWKKSLPDEDQKWISQTFFKRNARGVPVFQDDKACQQQWYHPSEPQMSGTVPPSMDRYFSHSLFMWLPKRTWKWDFRCPGKCANMNPRPELSLAGIHSKIRKVLSNDCFYLMATEILKCPVCKATFVGWHSDIRSQLSASLQSLFPAVLTLKRACDRSVVTEMYERCSGNGPFLLNKKLVERHSARWRGKVARYADHCNIYLEAASKGLITALPSFPEPPAMTIVPEYEWILAVYLQDVLQRLDFVKASITSTFGRILKMDATKKIVKKLQGRSKGTAEWCVNVGNEHGQVLMSVLTSRDGKVGLAKMVNGLMDRFAASRKQPPEVIYVDRDCCSGITKNMFHLWPQMHIRLDIWHFMRRIASACNSERHPMYGIFMQRLSECIFVWDVCDMQHLVSAKRKDLGIDSLSDQALQQKLTRREKGIHCKRSTRSAAQITQNIEQLLKAMEGPQGTDFLGEPLFDSNKLQLEWSKAKKHVCCILDPPGVTLYMQTGTINKGDQVLPVYRCARGSTSLESFHLHQNRFIPGTSTNDDHFQAFLLEGIMRWNEDRAAAAKSGGRKPGCYNLKLNHLVNGLYQKVWGKPLDPHYKDPKQYTGELLGLDYLHGQSGKVINLEDDDTEVGFVTEVEDLFQSILEDPTLLEDVPLCEEATLAVPPSVPLEVVTPPRTQVEEDCLARSTTPPFVPCVPEELHTPPAPTPPAPTPAPIPTPTPPAPTPAAMIAADDDKESIGPDGSGGFRSVVALAKHLVSLRDVMTLSNVQCTAILDLFHKLSPGDRQSCRSVFKPAVSKSPGGRYHCSKKGRLMSQGTTSASDKVHSSRNAGAAAHPSANRLMEAVFNELALIHPRPLVEGGHRQSRVHLMQGSYDRIRQLIISNPAFQAIPLQLPAVNNETVSKWFNEKCKMEEQKVLLQGLEEQLPHPRFTSSIPLPSSAPQASMLHQPCQQQPDFIFELPANRVGLSVKKRGRVAAPPSVESTQERMLLPALGQSATKILPAHSATSQQQRVILPAPVPSVGAKIMPACSATSQQHSVFLPAPGQSVAHLPARSATSQQQGVLLPAPVPSVPLPACLATTSQQSSSSVTHQPPLKKRIVDTPASVATMSAPSTVLPLPKSTKYYQLNKQKKIDLGKYKRGPYQRKEQSSKCKQCGLEESSPGHSRFKGFRWCEKSSLQTLEEWKQEKKSSVKKVQ